PQQKKKKGAHPPVADQKSLLKKYKLPIIIGGIVLFLIIAGVASFFLIPGFKEKFAPKPDPEVLRQQKLERQALEVTYLPMPEIKVNLKATNGSPKVLTATFVLALADENMRNSVNHLLPEIENQFNTFLREMTAKDLEGIAGIDRITREMLMRINRSITPFQILDVLVNKFYIK
ncbi:MAG: flagellar basal body-associated FliL family protein, partial [Alphaproteobacteria bacterium]|nr:flagellar basal body-associated FliL family protein [Alphaproteobacteria bacterium]